MYQHRIGATLQCNLSWSGIKMWFTFGKATRWLSAFCIEQIPGIINQIRVHIILLTIMRFNCMTDKGCETHNVIYYILYQYTSPHGCILLHMQITNNFYNNLLSVYRTQIWKCEYGFTWSIGHFKGPHKALYIYQYISNPTLKMVLKKPRRYQGKQIFKMSNLSQMQNVSK